MESLIYVLSRKQTNQTIQIQYFILNIEASSFMVIYFHWWYPYVRKSLEIYPAAIVTLSSQFFLGRLAPSNWCDSYSGKMDQVHGISWYFYAVRSFYPVDLKFCAGKTNGDFPLFFSNQSL